MPATRQRPTSRNRATQRRGARTVSHSVTRPNLLSLLIALGVVGMLVVLFPLDWLNKPDVNVTVERDAFSPNGDGTQEEVAAFYTLSKAGTVGVMVVNSAGETVRRLANEQAQPDGQHAATWNGRDDSGQTVPDGLYRIIVTAAGTAQSTEHSAPVEVDTRPPTLQLANFPADLTTRETKLTLEGTTEPNVTLSVSGDPRPVPVDARGVFRVERRLDEGLNPLDVRAVDAAGNETLVSRMVTLRTRPPALELLEPAENNSFVGNNLVTVRGTVPPDVTVTVNGRAAAVGEQGVFALDLVLEEGENVLTVVAQDAAGNEATVERQVTLRSQGPTITLANIPDGLVTRDPSVRVSGRVDPGTQLTVNGDTVPVDANGNFSTLVVLQGGNNLVTVTGTDIAGNATSVQRTVHYATASNPAPPGTVRLPSLPDNPLLWRLLVGVGLIGAALFLFGGLTQPIRFDLTVDYPTFYPNRPHEQRMLIMRTHLSRAAKVDLDVYDEFNRHVVSLVAGRRMGTGEHFRLWDGRNSVGQTLHGGSYLLQATARTATNTASSAVWVRLDPSKQPRTRVAATQERWAEEAQGVEVG